MSHVRIMSVAATALCFVCMVPPAILGVAAKTVDWTNSTLLSGEAADTSLVLPAVVWQETPYAVSLVTLAAVRY